MSRIRSMRMFETAAKSIENVIGQGADRYRSAAHGPQLLAREARLAADQNPDGRRAERLRLARALRRERSLGAAGHWSYDLNRHIALLQAWRAETQRPARKAP